MEFFPANALDLRPDLHAFRDRWYVSHLLAMGERPLYPPRPNQPPVYRLLFLPTFQQPAVVRLTEASGIWRAVCKRSDGLGGYSPGRLAGEAERELSRPEGERFVRLLDRVGFWEMPSSEDSAGLDGSQAVLEGAQAGGYRVVDRWSPHGTPYAELVEFLLELCPGVGDPAPDRNVGSTDREQLQGAWVVTRPGPQCTAPRVRIKRLEFQGDTLIWEESVYGDERDRVSIAYTLLPGLSPNGIDLVPTESGGRGKTYRGIYRGIYALEDGVLTICYHGPGQGRPNLFSPEGGATLITLRREGAGTSDAG